jgi:hypothetical protein
MVLVSSPIWPESGLEEQPGAFPLPKWQSRRSVLLRKKVRSQIADPLMTGSPRRPQWQREGSRRRA